MPYSSELAWEDCELPVVYLCENGVRIAMIYEDPILINPDNPDDLASWRPGNGTLELLQLLRLGSEYRDGLSVLASRLRPRGSQ